MNDVNPQVTGRNSDLAIALPDPVLEAGIRSVAHALSPTAKGTSAVIVPGGGSVEFSIPAGAGGRVTTSPSSPAYLLSALLFGAQTLAMTYGNIPGVTADPSRTAKAVQLATAVKDCAAAYDDLTHHDVDSAQAVGELFRTAANLAVGCLADQWGLAYGLTGAVASFAVGVVLWAVDGIRLAVDGVHAAFDTALYFRTYRIAVRSASTLQRGTPVQARDLLSAPVPALCEHPAGQLVDGALPGLQADGGPDPGYEFIDAVGGAERAVPPVLQDVTGDGVGDALAVVHCSAGGVSWPDTVLLYGPGTELLAAFDVGEVAGAEHSDMTTMTTSGRDVAISWSSYEGCCSDVVDWTGRLHYDGTRLALLDAHGVPDLTTAGP